jgi:hypothetical protein
MTVSRCGCVFRAGLPDGEFNLQLIRFTVVITGFKVMHRYIFFFIRFESAFKSTGDMIDWFAKRGVV